MQFGRHWRAGEEKDGETQKRRVSWLHEQHCKNPNPLTTATTYDSHTALMLPAFAKVDGKVAAEVTGSG